MLVWQRIEAADCAPFRGGVVTIGNFDGLHLGHQALLRQVAGHPGPRVVITFDPHPMQVLYPERGLKRLFPREDVSERLPDYGIDLLVLLPFTSAFAKTEPPVFLSQFVGPFEARQIVAGYDFGFGQDAPVIWSFSGTGQPARDRRLRSCRHCNWMAKLSRAAAFEL